MKTADRLRFVVLLATALGVARLSDKAGAATVSPATQALLDANPGLTSHSLLPKAAGRAGISFDALCERMVEMTMSRIYRNQ